MSTLCTENVGGTLAGLWFALGESRRSGGFQQWEGTQDEFFIKDAGRVHVSPCLPDTTISKDSPALWQEGVTGRRKNHDER